MALRPRTKTEILRILAEQREDRLSRAEKYIDKCINDYPTHRKLVFTLPHLCVLDLEEQQLILQRYIDVGWNASVLLDGNLTLDVVET